MIHNEMPNGAHVQCLSFHASQFSTVDLLLVLYPGVPARAKSPHAFSESTSVPCSPTSLGGFLFSSLLRGLLLLLMEEVAVCELVGF